jgi:2,3-dihydroxybiphenyl 1,2-dioxygenase
MKPEALAYLGLRTRSLEDWTAYGTGLVGLQQVDRSARKMAFRMDDRKQRFLVTEDGGEGISCFGWEVRDGAALDALAARVESHGVPVERGSRALADERRVLDLVIVNDPAGHRLEFCHGAETTTDPFVPGRNISGFRTGPLGLGHVVLYVETAEKMLPFYRDILGFGLSDYYYEPFEAYFFHVNARHHSLAFIANGTSKIHHMMVELYSLDDVGQGMDIAETEPGRIATSLGRHCGDDMTSFYTWNPSGFMVEYGWGGKLIDPATWQASERKEGPSLWGHNRVWLPQEAQQKARTLRMENARKGLRRPVQVLTGNHNLMPGACPWWDANVRQGKT